MSRNFLKKSEEGRKEFGLGEGGLQGIGGGGRGTGICTKDAFAGDFL